MFSILYAVNHIYNTESTSKRLCHRMHVLYATIITLTLKLLQCSQGCRIQQTDSYQL